MRFGLTVSSDDPPELSPVQRLDNHVRRAELARDVGFDVVAVNHRYSYGPARADERGEPLASSRFQPLPLLAHLAARLGDSVDYSALLVSSGLHPVQLVEDVSTIDAMTGGRFTLTLTLGWMPYEFEAFGVDMRTRGRRFEELVTAYSALITSDDVDLDGEHFRVDHARMVARPVQRPRPRLWIGGSADAAVRRAARLADAWAMSSHTAADDLARQLALFTEERRAAGRPMPEDRPLSRIIYLAEDRRTAVEEARPVLERWYQRRGGWGWFLTGPDGGGTDVTALAGGRWLIGDPDDCVEQISRLRDDLRVTQINLSMAWPAGDEDKRLRTIELFGDRVLPHLSTSTTQGPA